MLCLLSWRKHVQLLWGILRVIGEAIKSCVGVGCNLTRYVIWGKSAASSTLDS